jgi:UPF0755 protein
MNRLFKGLLIAGGLLFLIIAGNFVHGWNAAGPLAKETPIVIKSGASIRSAAGQLEDMGAIKSADAFVNRARIFRASTAIKAGEYPDPQAHASNARYPLDPHRRGKPRATASSPCPRACRLSWSMSG